MGMPVISPSQTTRCQAITDIIESVALEQAALSHLLNAEGEKLQRVVSLPFKPNWSCLAIAFAPAPQHSGKDKGSIAGCRQNAGSQLFLD